MTAETVTRGAIAMILMRVASAALSFLFMIIAARAWGAERLGVYSTLYAWFVVLQQIPALGLHYRLIRDLIQDTNARVSLVTNSAVISIACGVILATGVILTGLGTTADDSMLAVTMMALALASSGLIVVGEANLFSHERLTGVARITIVETTFRTVGWIAAILMGGGVASLFVILLIGRLVAVVLYLGRHGMLRIALNHAVISWSVIVDLLRSVPPLFLILLFSGLLVRMDMLLLAPLAGTVAVGVYAVGFRVVEGIQMIPQAFSLALYPRLSRGAVSVDEAGSDELSPLVDRIFHSILVVGVPGQLVLGLLAMPLVVFLYGGAYSAAGKVLLILSPLPLLSAIDQVLGNLLLATHRSREDAAVLGASCLVYAMLLIVMIHAWKEAGAALATIISAVFQVSVKAFLVRDRLFSGRMARTAMRTALGAGAAIGAFLAAGLYVSHSVAVGAGVATYLLAASLLGVLPLEEAHLLWNQLGERRSHVATMHP